MERSGEVDVNVSQSRDAHEVAAITHGRVHLIAESVFVVEVTGLGGLCR